MDINRNNYEAFLLDLLEGRLSVAEQRKLDDFLKQYPEFVADLPDLDLLSLEKPQLCYPLRDQLKKKFPTEDTTISADNFDLFSIARMEGDLSSQQEEEHRYLVSVDDKRQEEWLAWQKTRLHAEPVSFPGKNKLKRNQAKKGRVIWLSLVSAAASLTLVFILLKITPAVPGSGFSEAVQEELLTAEEAAVPVTETPSNIIDPDPLNPAIETSLNDNQDNPVAVGERKPSPDIQEEAEKEVKIQAPEIKQDPIAELDESSLQILPDPIEPRPLRIAGQLSSNSQLATVSPDQIKSLPLPNVSTNLRSLSVAQLAELDRKELMQEFVEEYDISLMSVANAGIKGINKLTGSDISLLASRDEEGEVSGFRLKSKRFSFTRPLSRQP